MILLCARVIKSLKDRCFVLRSMNRKMMDQHKNSPLLLLDSRKNSMLLGEDVPSKNLLIQRALTIIALKMLSFSMINFIVLIMDVPLV